MILVSLAACGDDGNPGTDTVCGDGTREGAEQCDDGNTTAGDGCSASCTTELSMSCGNGAVEGTEQCDDGNITSGDGCSDTCTTEGSMTCGNGTVEGTEECDDNNTTNGDGCSSTCQDETPPADCGNGMPNTGETCDDGNTTSTDGCSMMCQTEVGYTCTPATASTPSVCTMATPAGTCAAPFIVALTDTAGVLTGTGAGSTAASTNQVPMAVCSGGNATTGVGKDHVYSFTTTDVRDITIEIDDTITMFDTVLRVLSVPCDPSMDVDELSDGSLDGCVDFGGAVGSGEYIEYTALPAGTYYVVVDGFSATDEGAYSFTVTARPTLCGNGLIDPISAIPNTFDEICDDGDLMGSDGCNARCEEEPGFTCTGSTTPPPATVCTPIVCGNSLQETGETCDDGNMTVGDGCSATCQAEPGYGCTEGTGVGMASVCTFTCNDGTLDAHEECEDGNLTAGDRCSAVCLLESGTAEVEPNDTVAQVLAAGNHIIRGSFTADDVDLYTFTLAAPATVHIESYDAMDPASVYSGVGTLTTVDCTLNETFFSLFSSTGNPTMDSTALYTDDDDGDALCSYIGPQDSANDGTNDTADTNQGVLPAGTYTIKVVDLDGDAVSRYILDITIVSSTMTPVAPAPGDFVINEVMAADNMSDTNCDGSTTDTVDEFIELVNVSANTLDMAGVAVFETGVPATPRHTFAAGTTIAPGQALVLWGGGAPACPGVTNFAVAAAGLGLNDTGDTITIRSAGTTPVDLATLMFSDAEAEINVSLNRSPDVTGTVYALHTAVTGAVGAFTPGKRANNTAF